MNTVLPKNINYSDVKPMGYPSQIKQEKFTPIAFNTSTTGVQSSDIIRFNISTNGFWDPYSAYIKIEVDVSDLNGTKNANSTNCAGSLQIDNSAQSFINQLLITKGGVEIERIEEYDVISAILNDINSDVSNRVIRQYEGLGSAMIPPSQASTNVVFQDGSTGTTCLGWQPMAIQYPSNGDDEVLNTTLGNASAGQFWRYEFHRASIESQGHLQTTPFDPTGSQNIRLDVGQKQIYYNARNGWHKPFSSLLSIGSFEPILTPNFVGAGVYGGVMNSIPISKQTFCIPLVSGFLGILMPKDSYKYVPMKPLQDLQLEFRLSPYAMFSSGYNDSAIKPSDLDQKYPQDYDQIKRTWKITKFEINCEMQYFESSVENVILSQLNTDKGIILHTQSWQLGPRYQIAGNSAPQGSYQINLGYDSLKNVVWCFIPDDFQSYNFCRKQYRISANLTQYYFKIGNEYYPPLPISGQAGTAQQYGSDLSDSNNSEFLIQLYKTFGKFMDSEKNCIINSSNFAVNQRVYDPTLKRWIYSTNVGQNVPFWNNFDTAVSLPLFHENRCVGRAAYGMNLETLNNDFSVISGINTVNTRPFELFLKGSTINNYPRPYTLYVFCNYDMLIQIKQNSVNVLGRA